MRERQEGRKLPRSFLVTKCSTICQNLHQLLKQTLISQKADILPLFSRHLSQLSFHESVKRGQSNKRGEINLDKVIIFIQVFRGKRELS